MPKKFRLHLSRFDLLVLLVLSGLSLLSATLGYIMYGVFPVLIILCLLVLFMIGVLYEHYRRMQKKFDDQWNHYYQLESLQSLLQLIKLRSPLPPTRQWAVSPDFLNVLAREVIRNKPRFVLDLGSGISTIIAGYLLESDNGKVVGVDHDAMYAKTTIDYIEDHKLQKAASVLVAKLSSQPVNKTSHMWYDLEQHLKKMPNIDLLIVDGPPERTQTMARYPALPLLYEKLARDAVVLVDDANGGDIKEAVKQWQAQYPDLRVEKYPAEKGLVVLRRHK